MIFSIISLRHEIVKDNITKNVYLTIQYILKSLANINEIINKSYKVREQNEIINKSYNGGQKVAKRPTAQW